MERRINSEFNSVVLKGIISTFMDLCIVERPTGIENTVYL